MIQNERILEYIDGMLDPDSEQALFDALARQPELRAAMRQFICIGEAVRADREAYAPPAEVERSLMAGIGLSPAELGFVAPSVGIIERLGLLGGRYLGMIGAFILGVLLASVTVYQIVDGDDRDGSGAANHGAARGGAVQGGAASSKNGTTTNGERGRAGDRGALSQMNAPQGQAPSSSQGSAGSQQGNSSAPNGASNGTPSGTPSGGIASSAGAAPRVTESLIDRSNARGSQLSSRGTRRSESSRQGRGNEALFPPVTERSDLSSSSEGGSVRNGSSESSKASASDGGSSIEPRDIDIESVELRRSRADGRTVTVYDDIASNRSPKSIAPESSSISSLDEDDEDDEGGSHGALLEARGQIGWSLNESNARTVGSAGRNAFAAGAYWQPARSLAVGIEGGVESYDQTLRYRNGDTLQIDQRPTYLWGGATLRYYLGALSIDELSPFVQATLGGTSAGPLFRFRLGTEYDLGIDMSFLLSGEFSALFYSFDSQRLTSGRLGLTAGVQYNIR